MKYLLNSIFLTFLICGSLFAQSNDDCLMCHDDPELIAERRGREVSMHVDMNVLIKSVHPDHDCIDCHADASEDHPERLEPVDCTICHDNAADEFFAGIHGQVLNRGDIYAPTCKECHGTHDILSPDKPMSRTYKMNIPVLCGKCHREGAPVARVYNIAEHNILENYTQSIHGEGMFKKGLTVSATCNDCHGNHMILPHTNPKSSISLNRIAETCMTCHARIEDVHVKVIKGELWEEKPGAIPACTDCHPPHTLSRQNIVQEISDRSCLKCHEKEDVHKVVDGQKVSLVVDKGDITNSVHREIPCVKCHSDVTTSLKRPCQTAEKVDCANCHAEVEDLYGQSSHGQALAAGNENSPDCAHCHGTHTVKSKYDETASVFRSSIPTLCGECHKDDAAKKGIKGKTDHDVFVDYSQSIHGKGLVEKGLLPSAVCTDCHTSHFNLRQTDERSTVYPDNIPATCATCHRGIYKEYATSIHAIKRNDTSENLPTCANCHSSHTIQETENAFLHEVQNQCGECHQDLSETYFQTLHGKSFLIGHENAAKCSDCHGAHNILDVNNPKSMVSARNIVNTCKTCHEDANMRFTGYLTHATHHDKDKYPALYYTYWLMTSLLVGVFGFFGVHTLLWTPRSIQGLKQRKKEQKSKLYIKRFSTSQRVTHLFVILSFISLALTGMALKFANMEWAQVLAALMGGPQVAAFIHRVAAVVTFGYFIFHLWSLVKMKRRLHKTWFQFIFGKDSMMFNLQDLKDFGATIKWFFGLGKKPEYGRWTYWEKFDYFAVFWGVAVIGFSGLMLWFPEFFTQFMPGWIINIAHIIHSDEALLAVGFIFTVHFFNTHFRPEAFPMDTVIFTGMVSLEEYKKTRPREYEELKNSGQLRKRLVKYEPNPRKELAVKIFGSIWLITGILLIILIIYSVLFGYQ